MGLLHNKPLLTKIYVWSHATYKREHTSKIITITHTYALQSFKQSLIKCDYLCANDRTLFFTLDHIS